MDGWLIAASSREDNAVFLLQFIKTAPPARPAAWRM